MIATAYIDEDEGRGSRPDYTADAGQELNSQKVESSAMLEPVEVAKALKGVLSEQGDP